MHYRTIDTEYIILENIYDSGEQNTMLRQRDLALKTGASLGMTNTILRRLAQKGWISIKKLNRRNIQYAVTLDGINEIIHRSYNYFKRTIRNTMYYKEILDGIILKAKQNNTGAVVLIGSSDLDFIVEHACHCYGMAFSRVQSPGDVKKYSVNTLKIYGEAISYLERGDRDSGKTDSSDSLYLSKLVIKRGVELR